MFPMRNMSCILFSMWERRYILSFFIWDMSYIMFSIWDISLIMYYVWSMSYIMFLYGTWYNSPFLYGIWVAGHVFSQSTLIWDKPCCALLPTSNSSHAPTSHAPLISDNMLYIISDNAHTKSYIVQVPMTLSQIIILYPYDLISDNIPYIISDNAHTKHILN